MYTFISFVTMLPLLHERCICVKADANSIIMVLYFRKLSIQKNQETGSLHTKYLAVVCLSICTLLTSLALR